jgi:hypothetical protein
MQRMIPEISIRMPIKRIGDTACKRSLLTKMPLATSENVKNRVSTVVTSPFVRGISYYQEFVSYKS